MNSIIGTCSICGGPVSVPSIWHGIHPPQPTCERCGAIAAQHGPIIPMQPNSIRITYSGNSGQTIENLCNDSSEVPVGKTVITG